MSIESITVDKFTEEKVDSNNSISDTGTLKKKVGFRVKHTNGQLLIIDKWVAIVDGKSDDDSHSSSAGVLARPNAPFLEGYLPNFLITSACSYAY